MRRGMGRGWRIIQWLMAESWEKEKRRKAMSKPKKNIPKVIYLQIGEDCEKKDFSDLEGITWCEDRINKNDIRYILDKRQI